MEFFKIFSQSSERNSKSLNSFKDVEERSLWSTAIQRLILNRAAFVSALLIIFLAFICFVGPYFLSWSYDEIDWDLIEATPPNINNGHYLGTDSLGRDLLARILQGGQVSFQVGLLATMVAVIIGVTVGSLAGFLGGWIDQVLMRIVDILYVIPLMLLF